MFEFKVGILFFSAITVLNGQMIKVLNQKYFETQGFVGPKPTFQKSFYKARIDGHIFVELVDGPIVLENCGTLVTSLELSVDRSKYYTVLNPIPAYPSNKNCTIYFLHIYQKTESKLDKDSVDLIILRAIFKNYIISETRVIIFGDNFSDIRREISTQKGYDYIILNYYYFKVLLGIIIMTLVLVLILDTINIVTKYSSPYALRTVNTIY